MTRPTVGSLLLIAVLLACGVATFVGHGTVATVGIVVGALVLLALFGAGMGRGGIADYGRKGEVFRAEAETSRRLRAARTGNKRRR
ncbi:MAG: hypothetical protein JO304_16130 [Solirubrobacterales bacterium]|nr:hypothetical protein [Solirubrobacterales bacterium]